MNRLPSLAAACVALISLSGAADAGFTYSDTVTGQTITGPIDQNSGVGLQGGQSTGTLNAPTTATLFVIGANSSTPAPGTDNFVDSFTDTLTIGNVPSPGTSGSTSLILSIQIAFTTLNASSAASTLSINGVALSPGTSFAITAGGVNSTLSGFQYNQPTSNIAITGSLTALIGPASTVPEPASIALVGLGLAGVVGFSLRRKVIAA